MIRIGIIGSDSSHADAFSQLCNVENAPGRVDGARVVALWGQEPERTAQVAKNNQISEIVSDPKAMLGKVDAVMIVLRHGGLHCEHALPFLKAHVPVFVDKPFATTAADARRMVRAARKHGTPLTSFSTLRCAPKIVEFLRGLEKIAPLTAGSVAGPGDSKSQYGGFIFYGIHSIEAMQEAFGTGVRRVTAILHAGNLLTTVEYGGDAVVSLQVLGNASHEFHMTASGKKGVAHAVLDLVGCYPAGLKWVLDMVRTGREPVPHENMVEAIAVGEAIAKSLQTKKPVPVPRRLL